MRFAMGLTIIGALLFITGLLMVVVGEALRLKPGHGGAGIAGTGELVAFCGLGIGVALLVLLAVGRPDRRAADRARGGRARIDRAHGNGSGRGRRRAAGAGSRSGRRRDTAEEWLGPLRTAGARVAPQHVPPSWPESAESRAGADDYADDGWRPDLDEEWSPGPAYAWSPGEEDGWDNGENGDWDHGGGQDWNLGRDEAWYLGEPAGITAWPQAHLADPEPRPAPGYGSDRDAEHVAGPVDRTREDDTSPVPVVRDAGQPAAQPRASEPVPVPEPFSVWEPAAKHDQERDSDGRPDGAYRPAHAEPQAVHTQEKIEQIKDLYLTAEAIGEDALSRHFDELRQRQRSLISEFFENAGLGTKETPTLLGDDPAQDGASLPG